MNTYSYIMKLSNKQVKNLEGKIMKKTFKLDGLDCANCAMKIENAMKKIEGVEDASVNFMTTKLKISAEKEKMPTVVDTMIKTIKQLEPEVTVVKA